MFLKKTLAAVTLLSGLSLGAASTAVAHEISFNYTANGGFLVGTESGFPSGGTNDTVNFHNDDDSPCAGPECHGINWGIGTPDPAIQSGLHLNAAAGVVSTDGPLVDFGSLTHHNSPTLEAFSGEIDLVWRLNLETLGGVAVDTIELEFRLFVEETPNVPGDVDDEFTYALISGELSDVFFFAGEAYRVSLSGFYDADGNLSPIFYSPEGGENTGTVRFTVEHVVPAPGVLVLLGVGALAMGGAVRRRKR